MSCSRWMYYTFSVLTYTPASPALTKGRRRAKLTYWTDIKEANILTGYPDKRACSAFVRAELQSPSARKVVGKDSVPVYRSRTFPMAPPNAKEAAVSYHPAVLGDLQSAENGNVVNEDLVQPVCYRAPEANFGMAWSYPVDIWNLGVLVSSGDCWHDGWCSC